MPSNRDTTTIHIEFWEKGKPAPFAQSNFPLEELPETFEIDTSLDIADTHWSVIDAIPASKKEFSQTGKLKVILTKIIETNPKDIYYSLPTINATLPHLTPIKEYENLFMVSEDDWRQVEFLAEKHRESILLEIDKIEDIYSTVVDGVGFRAIHVRETIMTPLHGTSLSLQDLKNYFPAEVTYRGVAFYGTKAIITNSFAFSNREYGIFWGETNSDGIIITLNFNAQKSVKEVQQMDQFLLEKKLTLVDWSTMLIFGKDDLSFQYYQ